MASDKGFPSKDREISRDIPQDHITAGPVRSKQWAKDTVAHNWVFEVATDAAEASSTTSVINATAHAAKAGDIIRFTSGNLSNQEFRILSTDANSIELVELMSEAPNALDAFQILRFKHPVVNADGTLSTTAAAGGATEAKQDAIIAELQLKADLTETQPVSATSLPLPSGAATEATLSSLDSKDFATQTTLAALLTELQAKADLAETQPVSAASLPLPTGAATEATLSSIDGKDFATQTTLAALLTELQAKADLAETQPVSAASLPLPTGASTEATLAALSAKIPAALGQTTKAGSLSVTIASDQEAVDVALAAKDVTEFIRNDYTSTNVTTAAYVELIASTSADITKMQIFDSSGQTLVIATGAAASEVDKFYVFPGGNGDIEVSIPSGTRVSIKAVSATADAGEISINLIG